MHDYVTNSKFTTKPRLREIFSNLRYLCVVFTCMGILFIFAALGFRFAICILKARLGDEICLSDVIMHKGY